MLKYDGSITLNDVQFSFNGTYTCQVRNPPDVHGFTGEIRLEVVQSGESVGSCSLAVSLLQCL